jgi:VIT1/CCC1 family predicted Fe2+/Mn2+ transporter
MSNITAEEFMEASVDHIESTLTLMIIGVVESLQSHFELSEEEARERLQSIYLLFERQAVEIWDMINGLGEGYEESGGGVEDGDGQSNKVVDHPTKKLPKLSH